MTVIGIRELGKRASESSTSQRDPRGAVVQSAAAPSPC